MKTKTVKPPILTTREQAEEALTQYAILVNSQRKIITNRDAAILDINNRVAPHLAGIDDQLTILAGQLHAWAAANPDQFPGETKTLKLASGTIAFRTCPPRVALISRAFTWEKVLSILQSGPWRNYTRTKTEVDKEAILSGHSQAKDKSWFTTQLARFGLKIAQDEQFEIAPDLTRL